MHRFYAAPLVAALLTVLTLSAARAQELSSSVITALPGDQASNEVSLPSDFTGSGGVGSAADPGGGGMIIQMLPASDTGISNAPSNFHYVRSTGR